MSGWTTTQAALPANVEREDNKRLALQLRIGGATYEQIGVQLKLSTSTAHVLVVEALDELASKTVENAEQLRALELSRLDDMLAALNTRKDGNSPRAIDTKIRIMERRAKLMGIDAPSETVIIPGQGAGASDRDPIELLKRRINATAKAIEAGAEPKAAAAEAIAEVVADATAEPVVPPPTTPTNGNGDHHA